MDLYIIYVNKGRKMSGKDRREHHRVHLGEKVEFGVKEYQYKGITYDLSPNGISIISEVSFPVGTRLNIKIYSEIAGSISVEGEVVWVNTLRNLPSRMGIKLTKSYPKLIDIYRTMNKYKSS